jgi:hypothetical protein
LLKLEREEKTWLYLAEARCAELNVYDVSFKCHLYRKTGRMRRKKRKEDVILFHMGPDG